MDPLIVIALMLAGAMLGVLACEALRIKYLPNVPLRKGSIYAEIGAAQREKLDEIRVLSKSEGVGETVSKTVHQRLREL